MHPLLRVLAFLSPYRWMFVASLGAAALATLVDLVPPWILKHIIDDVIQGSRPALLPWFVAAYLAAHAVRGGLGSLVLRLSNRVEKRVVHDLRVAVFAGVQRQSLRYFEHRSTGDMLSRVTSDTSQVEEFFIDGLESLVTASLTLLCISVILLTINWRLLGLALVPIRSSCWPTWSSRNGRVTSIGASANGPPI